MGCGEWEGGREQEREIERARERESMRGGIERRRMLIRNLYNYERNNVPP